MDEVEQLRARVEALDAFNREMRADIEAATRKEGRLYEALERSWQPPSGEPPTETELRLAVLNEPPTGGRFVVEEPEPEWGSPEHIARLPVSQRSTPPRTNMRSEAARSPENAQGGTSSSGRPTTPTLKLTED